MKKKHTYLPIIISVILLLIGIVVNIMIYTDWTKSPVEAKNVLASKVTEQEKGINLKTIIYEAQKNVVQIVASNETTEKIGSGFLYNNKGDIITNAHVVKGSDFITVKMANAQTYTAAVVGIGEKQDVALVRVPQLANQPPAIIAKDYHAEIGDEILAVGSPLGFQNSVTLGIISGTNRSFTIDTFDYKNSYQISANITHGNSGGPLINRSTGEVVAINSAGTDEGSIGFSIPISGVMDKVNKWSDEAENEDLDFNRPSTQDNNPKQMEEDAEYIVNYFFESLSIRDYINAYTLLGSDLQSQITYQEFRKDYIHVFKTTTSDMKTEFDEKSNTTIIKLKSAVKIRKSNNKTENKQWEYSFTIGHENGQLKILKSTKAEISTSSEDNSDK